VPPRGERHDRAPERCNHFATSAGSRPSRSADHARYGDGMNIRLPLVIVTTLALVAACAGDSRQMWTPIPAGSATPAASPEPGASGALSPAPSGEASPVASGEPAASGSPAASGEPAASGSPATSGEPAASGDTTGGALTIGTDEGTELLFVPEEVEVATGAAVSVTFENVSEAPHNLTFGDPINAATDPVVNPGAEQTIEFTAPAPGDYTYVCTLHPGMDGVLHVTE
jgi:plastocyanin